MEQELNIPAIINQLKTNLERWISSCETCAGHMVEIGHDDQAKNFEGQATAYWAVKTFLEENNL